MGRELPTTLRVTMRPDAPGGISLAGGRVFMPGETADVPYALAAQLLATGRATLVAPAPDPAVAETPVVETPAGPAVTTRDPLPRRRGR